MPKIKTHKGTKKVLKVRKGGTVAIGRPGSRHNTGKKNAVVNRKNRNAMDGFYCVPDCFAANKNDAELFAKCIKHVVDRYDLVYTRNEIGRKILLEGRSKALANKQARCVSKKKVKGALE